MKEFIRDHKGKPSSTRLAVLVLVGDASIIVGTVSCYVLRDNRATPGILYGLAAILAGLVANGVVAIARRDVPAPKTPEPPKPAPKGDANAF